MQYNCLIIDDEEMLAEATCDYLNMFDVKSAYVTNSKDCLNFIEENQVDLLLLDINLQDESGFALCKTLRETSNIPIMFISARQNDDDVLFALTIGGDDYIKKPYTLSILLAKVKAMLKRCGETTVKEVVEINHIRIDEPSHKVWIHDVPMKLRTLEFRLLSYFMHNKNRVITKDELFDHVWGGGSVSDSTLNVHIRHLREKIETDPNSPSYIKTVWGTGYLFEVEE